MTNRKLLFVVNTASFFLSHRRMLGTASLKEGYEVHVAGVIGNCRDQLESLGIRTHEIALDRQSTGLLSNAKTFIQILLLFLKLRPDIVHLITIKPVLLGGIAARFTRLPGVVAAISGLGFIFIAKGRFAVVRRTLVMLLYRLALKHRNMCVIFQNTSDKEAIAIPLNLMDTQIKLIRGSGVDLQEFSKSEFAKGEIVVSLIARMLRDKGVYEFVNAAKLIKSQNIKARFVLVGGPDLGNPATIPVSKLKEWTASGTVEWLGHQTDIPKIMKNSHIVVLPSYREGLPKVLVEAAATGRPVITTDVPGCRDAIKPNKSGLLVPVEDDQALADAIKLLITNPSLCKEMGQQGRNLAQNVFDVKHITKQHLTIYSQILSKCPS